MKLEQTAVLVCADQAEYDQASADVLGRYGADGVNEGLLTYTMDGYDSARAEWTITLTRTLDPYRLE